MAGDTQKYFLLNIYRKEGMADPNNIRIDLDLDKIPSLDRAISPADLKSLSATFEQARQIFTSTALQNIKFPKFDFPDVSRLLEGMKPIEIDGSWVVKRAKQEAEEAQLRRLMLEEHRSKNNSPVPQDERYIDNAKFLSPTTDGGFRYKEKMLRSISLDQAEGRFLALLLQRDSRFARDEEILKVLELDDNRGFGFILRNLKKAFTKNALKIIIDRRKRNKGYVLIDIEEKKKRTNRLKTLP